MKLREGWLTALLPGEAAGGAEQEVQREAEAGDPPLPGGGRARVLRILRLQKPSRALEVSLLLFTGPRSIQEGTEAQELERLYNEGVCGEVTVWKVLSPDVFSTDCTLQATTRCTRSAPPAPGTTALSSRWRHSHKIPGRY